MFKFITSFPVTERNAKGPGHPPYRFNLYLSLGQFSRQEIGDIFLIFPRKQTICMKCEILFSGKNKENISIDHLLKSLPGC